MVRDSLSSSVRKPARFSPVQRMEVKERKRAQRTVLPRGEDSPDERCNRQISDAKLVTEQERPLMLVKEALDLLDTGAERGGLILLSEEEELVKGAGNDGGEAADKESSQLNMGNRQTSEEEAGG